MTNISTLGRNPNGIPAIPVGPGSATQPYRVDLQKITQGYDRDTCWVHARSGIVPAPNSQAPSVVTTMQKLRLSGSDVFFDMHSTHTNDMGQTWSPPAPQVGLRRERVDDQWERVVCDFYPKWHAHTQTLLGIGHTAYYVNTSELPSTRPRQTAHSVYDPQTQSWSQAQYLQMPDSEKWHNSGAGSAQRVDLPNGEILLPMAFWDRERDNLRVTTVMRCSFDGQLLAILEQGCELRHDVQRGFIEPSLATFDGRYFLTIRNDKTGYVTSSPDGLHFDKPIEWTFDDGQPLGNYNTQQHWVTHSDALYLVYTRRGLNNDHVFRHRAPLVMAQVDTENLCIIRETEQIIVPDRGARLGNFGTVNVTPDQTWVTAAEWMQTTSPNPRDFAKIESYGANNTVWCARIHWDKPNALVK